MEIEAPWLLKYLWKELVDYEDCSTIIYAGRMNGGILAIQDLSLIDFINNKVKSGITNIIFDNMHETLILSEIEKIYNLLPALNVGPANIYYLTASSDALIIHETLCKQNNWNPINIVIFNTFEETVKMLTTQCNHAFGYQNNKKKTFLCMNRNPHLHRVCLLGLLHQKNLINGSNYSFYDYEYCKSTECNIAIKERLSVSLSDTIIKEIDDLSPTLPMKLTLDKNCSNPMGLLPKDIELFKNSYFSIVPETYFFNNSFLNEQNSMFLTEKTFNAILMKHPFILMGMPNSLKHLQSLGYKTFTPYINESYDTISNDEERLLAIVNEIEQLCKLSDEQWIDWQTNINDIVNHNYDVLINRPPSPLNNVSLSRKLVK